MLPYSVCTWLCRWCPQDHEFRTDPSFGPPNHNDPPDPRQNDECVEQGKASDNYRGFKNAHVKDSTGINRRAPYLSSTFSTSSGTSAPI